MSVIEARRAETPLAGQPHGDLFAPPLVEVERLADGGMILRSPVPLNAPPRCLKRLARTLGERSAGPDLPRRARRSAGGSGWRTLTFAEAHAQVRAVAQALLDRGLSPERPILILAENGIDHGARRACRHACRRPGGAGLDGLCAAQPGLRQAALHLRADRAAARLLDDPSATATRATAVDRRGARDRREPRSGARHDAVRRPSRHAATERRASAPTSPVGPDTVAKILFTSGSTGLPKGVINTQRMLCSNQEAIAQVWPFLAAEPPVIVDWLPWNHTFGGNHNFNMMLRNGGTLYIDEGKPVPALIDRTVANLREVSPTDLLQRAARLRHAGRAARSRSERCDAHFFSRLRLLFYAGAGAAAEPVGAARGLLDRRRAASKVADDLRLGPDRDGADGDRWCTSRSTAPASSACRRPASSSSSRPRATSSRCACAART